jgi:putative oxygen-independent coproporphyrinogen III oxidase
VILREIETRFPSAQGRSVDTVFFGGGTPSLLAAEFMERIHAAIRSRYDLSNLREMTIECNPSSLKREKLDFYSSLGFTRMSIGIQSFHADELRRLGRVHTPETARQALEAVAADGRFHFSGDLIFGAPGQTGESFLESLDILLSHGPDHVSFYGLTIEEGTEFARQKASGALIMPEDGIYNGMYAAGVSLLEERGYSRYEVSNFCKPGRSSLHNQGYWNNAEYAAFGPGAHCFLGGKRSVSPASFEAYLEWGARGFDAASCTEEILTRADMATEAVLLGLRQAGGADMERLRRLGLEIPEGVLGKWEAVGMLARENDRIRLIGDGWLFLDEIGSDLLARSPEVQASQISSGV